MDFQAGEQAKPVVVSVWGDTQGEADETFFVRLTGGGGGAPIADGEGVGNAEVERRRTKRQPHQAAVPP